MARLPQGWVLGDKILKLLGSTTELKPYTMIILLRLGLCETIIIRL